MSMTKHVIRGNKRSPPSRYSPYATGPNYTEEKEKQKEDAVQLGVELSLFVAETIFLLSDDIRSVLRFCHWLLDYVGNRHVNGPVVERLFLVIEDVFEKYIKPKNRVFQDGGKSTNWALIWTYSQNLTFGIRGLSHIVSILKFDGLVKSTGFEHNKQELKNLEEKLRSVKHLSEANGFAREAIESNILQLWKSLFETTTTKVMNPMVKVIELFRPLLNEERQVSCRRHLASLLI